MKIWRDNYCLENDYDTKMKLSIIFSVTGTSAVSTASLSMLIGGSYTAGVLVVEVWAHTLDGVGPSAGGAVLVRLCFGLVSVSLKGLLSVY